MTEIERALPADLAYESKFQWLTRVGFLARGLLYILVGILAIGAGRTEDLTGALEYVAKGFGRGLLIVIAIGLVTYALWRLSDASFGTEHGDGDSKALRKRAAAAGIGLIYLYMSYKAFRILTAGQAEAGNAQQERASDVLQVPGGWMVLGAVGLFIIGAGIFQLIKAAKCSYLKNLESDAMSPAVKWLGRIGYAARGVVFICAGWMVGQAALHGRSGEVGGMEQALDMFDGGALYAVAGGLVLFGLFSFVEARYRRIHRPPSPRAMAAEVRDQIPR